MELIWNRNHSIQQTLHTFLNGFGLLIPHLVVAGGIGLAAASGSSSSLLEAGLVVFALGWLIAVAFIVLSWKADSSSRRLDDEKKVREHGNPRGVDEVLTDQW